MRLSIPTVEGRQKDWEAMVDDERTLLLNKGADYTAGQKDVDAYANFRIIADLLEDVPVTPYTVAMIYALKHVLSLITFAKTGKQESGEGLRGRHMDARNYFFILNELVPDHVNHFEDAETAEAFNVEVNNLPKDHPFIYVLNEDNVEVTYMDESTQTWRPISELNLGKEVDNSTKDQGLDTVLGQGACS
jgi:hypothetical protein